MAASTHIRLNPDPLEVTSTNGVGFSIVIDPAIAGGVPKGLNTYMLTVVNDGAELVTIHAAGTGALTGVSPHRVQPNGGTLTIGPLHIKDEQPRLWSAADSDCVIELDAVTGEA